MATIATLLVRIGADNSQLRAVLARSSADLKTFARGPQSLKSVFGNFGAAIPNEFKNAKRAIDNLKNQFGQKILEIRRKFDEGMISRGSMERQGRKAGKELADALTDEANKRFKRSNLGQNEAARLRAGILAQRPEVSNTAGFAKLAEGAGRVQQIGQNLTRFVTVPLAAVGAIALKSAGDFEAGFNRVKAVTAGTKDEIDSLRKAALELSLTSKFGPTEIAEGLAVLGQAGFTAAESLKAIAPALRLATIENLKLDETTTSLAQTFREFDSKIPIADIADKLTVASLKGTVSLHDLSESLKQAGTLAATSGQSLDDVLAGLVIFGQRGITASLGGTALKNTFARLVDIMPKASKALDELAKKNGVASSNFKDLKGNLLPLPAILQKLAALKIPLGELFKIFQLRAAPGVAALIQAGTGDFAKLAAQIRNSKDEAERVAAIQFTGFKAEITKLGHAFQVLAVAIGDTGILEELTKLVARLTNFVTGLRKVDPALIQTTALMVAAVAAIGPLISIIAGITRGVALLVTAFEGMSVVGALSVLLGPGAVLLVGLAILGQLLFDIASKAITAAQAMGAFVASLAGLDDAQLKTLDLGLLKSQLAILEKIKALEAKHPTANLHVPEFNAGKILLRPQENEDRIAVLELDRALKKIEGSRKAIAAAAKLGADAAKKEADAARDAAAAMEKAKKKAESTQNAASASAAKKALLESAQQAHALALALKNADVSSRGLANREELLAPSLDAAIAKAKEMQDAFDKLTPKQRSLLPPTWIAELNNLKRQIELSSQSDATPFRQLVPEADAVLAKMEAIRDAQHSQTEEAQLLAPLLAQARDLEARVAAIIKAQGGEQRANNEGLRLRNRLLRQVPQPTPLQSIGVEGTVAEGAAAKIGAEFDALRHKIQAATTAKDFKLVQQLQEEEKVLKDQAAGLTKLFIVLLATLNLAPAKADAALKQFLDLLGEANTGVGQLDAKTQAVIDTLGDVRGVLDDFGALAEAIGGINDDLIAGVNNVGDLIGAMQNLSQFKDILGKDFLKALPGLIGAASAGVKIIADVVNTADPADLALRRQNNTALRDLTLELRESKGLGGQASVADAIGKLNLDKLIVLSSKAGNPGTLSQDKRNQQVIDEINRELANTGLTFEDVAKQAKELGIELINDKGKLVPKELETLRAAALASAEALRHFSGSIDNIALQRDTREKLRLGRDLTPAETLGNQVSVFQRVAPALAKFIDGIDTTTEEGRDKLRKQLLALTDAIEFGAVAAEDFGQFKDADEALAFINQFADNINAAADAVKTFAATVDSLSLQKDVLTKLATGKALTPEQTLNNQVSVFSEVAPALRAFVGAIDTTTEQGRTALRARLTALVLALQQGTIPLESFGDFANADEILNFINTFADNLNALGEATNAVTKSMQHVPAAFKIDLARFRAQDFFPPPKPVLPPPLPPVPVGPKPPIIEVKPPGGLRGTDFNPVIDTLKTGTDQTVSQLKVITALLSAAAPAPAGATTVALDPVTVALGEQSDQLNLMIALLSGQKPVAAPTVTPEVTVLPPAVAPAISLTAPSLDPLLSAISAGTDETVKALINILSALQGAAPVPAEAPTAATSTPLTLSFDPLLTKLTAQEDQLKVIAELLSGTKPVAPPTVTPIVSVQPPAVAPNIAVTAPSLAPLIGALRTAETDTIAALREILAALTGAAPTATGGPTDLEPLLAAVTGGADQSVEQLKLIASLLAGTEPTAAEAKPLTVSFDPLISALSDQQGQLKLIVSLLAGQTPAAAPTITPTVSVEPPAVAPNISLTAPSLDPLIAAMERAALDTIDSLRQILAALSGATPSVSATVESTDTAPIVDSLTANTDRTLAQLKILVSLLATETPTQVTTGAPAPVEVTATAAGTVVDIQPLIDELVSGFGATVEQLRLVLAILSVGSGQVQAPEGASGAERAVAGLLEALRAAGEGVETAPLEAELRELVRALSAAGLDVGPEVQKLIDVFTAIVSTGAANAMRGFQEAVVNANKDLTSVEVGTTGRNQGTGTVTFNFGDIKIEGADKSAREQWKDVKNIARQEAKAKFGDTRRWSEVP